MPPEKSIFSFFVAYIYGILGVEAAATLKRIAIRLATTWQQPYTSICGYVNIGITIILVRATLVHPGVQGTGTQDQCPAPAVGG